MKYMGSKARYADQILPIVLAHRGGESLYVEPFMGGANTFHLVDGPKWGNDLNVDVVEMFKAIAEGWEPPTTVTEAEYEAAKTDYSNPRLRGFIGIASSYGGKFFGGYARGKDGKGQPRNYTAESRRNVLRQAPGMRGAHLTSMSYLEMDIPDGSVVYCDPPYRGVTQYGGAFDSDKFWEWCAALSATCSVFVSEYAAPRGWRCVWSADTHTSLAKRPDGCKRATERLFVRAGDE